MKRPKECKIRLTSNMMLCIPFFILWGIYMILGAVMAPLSPTDESYMILSTAEKYIGIAICVYVCIYSLVSISQKNTPIIRRCLCCLLLVTGILGFFYLESGFLYFDLVLVISLIYVTQKNEKVNADYNTTEREIKVLNTTSKNDSRTNSMA